MSSPFDTIVAPITAPGRGAVAAVRISGPDAYSVARAVFPSLGEKPRPRYAVHGNFLHGDDGLALPFEAGHSYTGEAVVELFVHGSPTSVRLLVDGCLAAGARPAQPGEFTLRAFANGKLDLTQAEAVVEVVNSQTSTQLKAAGAQLAGALGEPLTAILSNLEIILVRLEASLDFSEEIGPLDYRDVTLSLGEAASELEKVLSWEQPSQLVRDGLRVALVGAPNAGKSSLFNRLCGSERAIVTNIPGTTRDVLEATIDIRGIPVTLFDTAGLRSEAELVEQIGIQRALETATRAHTVLYLYDSTVGLTDRDQSALAELPGAVTVATKADLAHQPVTGLEVSAISGAGMAELLETIVAGAHELQLPYLLNGRHTTCLREAQLAVTEAAESAAIEAAPDLILPALYHATSELRQVLGLGVAPDVIDSIFAKFCIGK